MQMRRDITRVHSLVPTALACARPGAGGISEPPGRGRGRLAPFLKQPIDVGPSEQFVQAREFRRGALDQSAIVDLASLPSLCIGGGRGCVLVQNHCCLAIVHV